MRSILLLLLLIKSLWSIDIVFLNSTVESVNQKYTVTSTYDEVALNMFGELFLTKYNTSYLEKFDSNGSSLWSNSNSSSDITTDFMNVYTEGWGGPLNKYFNSSTALLTDSTNAHGYYIDADESGAVYCLINGGGVKRMNPLFSGIDWTFDAHTDLGLSDAIASDVKYRDGYVYIIGVDWDTREEVYIYKINTLTGSKVWRYDYSAGANAQDGVLAITDENVYASFASNRTVKLDINSGVELNSTTYIDNIVSDGKYLYGNVGNIKKFNSDFVELSDLGTGVIKYFKENGYVKYDSGTHYVYETNSSSIDIPYNLGVQNIKFIVNDLNGSSLITTVFNGNSSLSTITENWTNPSNGILSLTIAPSTTMAQSTYLEFTISDGGSSIDKNLTINFIEREPLALNLNLTLQNVNLSEFNITSIRVFTSDDGGATEDFFVYNSSNDGALNDLVENNFSNPVFNPDNNFSIEINQTIGTNQFDWFYNFSDGKLYPDINDTLNFKYEINSTNSEFTMDFSNRDYFRFSGNLLENDKNITDVVLISTLNSSVLEYNLTSDYFEFNISETTDYFLGFVTDSNQTWYYDFATGEIDYTHITPITLNESNLSANLNVSLVKFSDYVAPADLNISLNIIESPTHLSIQNISLIDLRVDENETNSSFSTFAKFYKSIDIGADRYFAISVEDNNSDIWLYSDTNLTLLGEINFDYSSDFNSTYGFNFDEATFSKDLNLSSERFGYVEDNSSEINTTTIESTTEVVETVIEPITISTSDSTYKVEVPVGFEVEDDSVGGSQVISNSIKLEDGVNSNMSINIPNNPNQPLKLTLSLTDSESGESISESRFESAFKNLNIKPNSDGSVTAKSKVESQSDTEEISTEQEINFKNSGEIEGKILVQKSS